MSLEVVTIRRVFLIVPLLLVLVLSGCQNAFGFVDAKWITEISLSQHQVEQEQQEPLQSKVFTEAAFIKTMAEAMNKSSKLSGELDYGPEYDMKLVYGDGYIEEYYLALGEENGYEGLLVSAEKSGQGYSIPVKNSDKLRDLIFGASNAAGTDGAESVAKVSVTSPVTLSRNELYHVTRELKFLDLRLLEGQYSENWTTSGPLMGRSWSGQFQLVVTDELGETLSAFPLSSHFADELTFTDFFQIHFADYNGDGNTDFTIGQYGSSNGSFYKLFTLTKDNVIEELSIKPQAELFISSPERYSVTLDKVDEHSFRTSYYDNAAGKQAESVFQWDGTSFQKLSK